MSPIQGAMIAAIGKCCGRSLNKNDILAIFKAASMRVAGRVASQVLVWQVPVVGNVINVGTAAVVTESIGWSAYKLLCEEDEDEFFDEEQGEVVTTTRKKSPGHIDIYEFKSFVQTIEGKILQTRKQRSKFSVQVTDDGIIIKPKTAAPVRTIENDEIGQFLDAFAVRRKSLESRDYKDMGIYTPYILALLGKYTGK